MRGRCSALILLRLCSEKIHTKERRLLGPGGVTRKRPALCSIASSAIIIRDQTLFTLMPNDEANSSTKGSLARSSPGARLPDEC